MTEAKRKVGRPPNPKRKELQKKRRFIQLEKTAETLSLIAQARIVHARLHNGDAGTDAEILRDALRHYTGNVK